jgi:hypothetical protein
MKSSNQAAHAFGERLRARMLQLGYVSGGSRSGVDVIRGQQKPLQAGFAPGFLHLFYYFKWHCV